MRRAGRWVACNRRSPFVIEDADTYTLWRVTHGLCRLRGAEPAIDGLYEARDPFPRQLPKHGHLSGWKAIRIDEPLDERHLASLVRIARETLKHWDDHVSETNQEFLTKVRRDEVTFQDP